MNDTRFEPFFLDGPAGRIFAILRAASDARHAVLIIPPFGEEMNKSRRQFTEVAQRLVAKGYAVLVVDLYGTGDSEGEFSEASWEGWRGDIEAAFAWLEGAGFVPDSLIAVRSGCLLATDSLGHFQRSVVRSVFWQPVESGKQFMNQFLRLRVAASMMSSDSKETVESLKSRLEAGESLEIAGYELAPDLWRSFQPADLKSLLHSGLGQLEIIEVGRSKNGALSVAGQRLVEAARAVDLPAAGSRVSGEPFWTATEIVTNPQLTELTVACLSSESPQ